MSMKRSRGGSPGFGSSLLGSSGATFVDTMTTTGTNPSITVPAGIADGDLCVWLMATRNGPIPATGPEGDSSWDEVLRYDIGTDEEYGFFTKVSDGTESSTWDMTCLGTAVGVMVIRGVSAVTAFYYSPLSKTTPMGVGQRNSLQLAISAGNYNGTIASFTDPNSELDSRISVIDGSDAQVVVGSKDCVWDGPTLSYIYTAGAASPYYLAATLILT